MKTVALSVLFAAALLAVPANAQDTGPPPPETSAPMPAAQPQLDSGWDQDAWRQHAFDQGAFYVGMQAFERKKYARAEASLTKALADDATHGETNFYLGVARMQLGKWDAARAPLEIARDKLPAHPDPKSRLGVTYAMLGDMDAAHAERADLVRMAAACGNSCKLSPYIRKGIAMIDAALAQMP